MARGSGGDTIRWAIRSLATDPSVKQDLQKRQLVTSDGGESE